MFKFVLNFLLKEHGDFIQEPRKSYIQLRFMNPLPVSSNHHREQR